MHNAVIVAAGEQVDLLEVVRTENEISHLYPDLLKDVLVTLQAWVSPIALHQVYEYSVLLREILFVSNCIERFGVIVLT